MSDCRRIAERLTPYVDEALDAKERTELERHLAKCPPCQTAADEEHGGRTILRSRASTLRCQTPSARLRTRCASLAREHCNKGRVSRASRGASRWLRLSPAMMTTTGAVLLGCTLVWVATSRSNTVLAAQLTVDHLKCFRLFGSAQPEGVNARDVDAMLASRYGWNVHVPPTSGADGVVLVGARRCLYAKGTVPHVMYTVHGQDVSLYVLKGVTRQAADLVTLGHRARIWTRGDTTYVLVSPSSRGAFAQAAAYVMQKAQ